MSNAMNGDPPWWVYRRTKRNKAIRRRSRENLKLNGRRMRKERNKYDPRSKPEPYVTGNQPKYTDSVYRHNTATYVDWRGNSSVQTIPVRRVESLLISRGNPKVKGYYRSGGDFFVDKVTQWGNPDLPAVTGWKAPNDGGGWRFTQVNSLVTGEVVKQIFPVPLTVDEARSRLNSLATQYEATGRARIDPFRPIANNGQSIVETLRDRPKLIGRDLINWLHGPKSPLSSLPKVVAGEYLNMQFGVMPTVRDFVDGLHLLKNLEKIKDRLRKESGKRIRRTRTLKNQTTVTVLETGGGNFPFGSDHGETLSGTGIKISRSSRVRWKINREKVWYVARFTYYLPPQTPFQDLKLNAQLGGLVPNLSNAWAVTPWSWLAGWFSNINDVLRNISSNMENNIVLEYSYVMRETEETVYTTYTHELEWDNDGDPNKPTGNNVKARTNWTVKYSTKERAGGRNPFGLYVGIDELDTFQQSILAALGISRSRVKSR